MRKTAFYDLVKELMRPGFLKSRMMMLMSDRTAMKRIYLITFAFAVIFIAISVRNMTSGERYIVDEKGNVVGVYREDVHTPASFDLELHAVRKGKKVEKDITISPLCVKSRKNTAAEKEKNDREVQISMDAEINRAVSKIEGTGTKKIRLPSELSDGSRLVWQKKSNESDETAALLICYCILVILAARGSACRSDRRTEAEKKRKEVVRKLPRFTNQLMLTMNAGMILSDAFIKICDGYTLLSDEENGFFEKSMVYIASSSKKTHRASIAGLVTEFASEVQAKEMLRISALMTENERRGSDITGNLESESKYLWDSRKLIAKEKGKMIDTKMAYPMAMLLILLIIITMAPAMLSM